MTIATTTGSDAASPTREFLAECRHRAVTSGPVEFGINVCYRTEENPAITEYSPHESTISAGRASARTRHKAIKMIITELTKARTARRPGVTAQIALAGLLAFTLGCASSYRQEGSGEYVDNSVITGKVKAAVFNDPALKSAEINVETFKGVVQLSGFVGSQADINQALALARTVDGVTAVKNDMRIKGTP